MQELATLETVEQDFINWRKTRSSRTARIPQALWDKVGLLKQRYKHTEICRRLKLSGGQFKRKAQSRDIFSAPESLEFITATPSVPLAAEPVMTLFLRGKKHTLELSVRRDNIDCIFSHLLPLL